ncbi:L protein [Mammarenavirus allpahuayoense]|uniref:RNA-directed RNA polymerase L n=1 Tax=Allpahuayo mammarenavirus (isolate Rat/Peru/CLHP-2472/1997) TaxID=144752 RepID=L_ALLVP|nr:L protein [Mammarenavirus allpahuayoense]Q6XQI9.2 RecName: Full=RNA-directed RNA polymerase L; Short=Protein L; AltName: Full=Large structural protein; AltName: Full=Replicase; AltName: Full=Transcriptase; Includes: RecName: Full=cap-snatching endonuclease [Mammarenavirus allpahuayoense]AAP44538.2 L protein [Mammarenavirus allpahuayoense]
MDVHLIELRDLVRKWVPDDLELSEQKNIMLAQTQIRATVVESLKLLSTIVEVDSCKKHSCVHNTSKTVNAILREHKIIGPTLPDVTPDGYCVIGDVLILLEVFVRTNQESFEKKFNQDFEKLMQMSADLKKCGVTLVPTIDGRSTYYVDFIPDWVVERLRWLISRLMSSLREDGQEIEELEYERLISSLSSLENQSLGLESLLAMREKGLSYKETLDKLFLEGMENKLTVDESRTRIMKMFQIFRTLLESGYLERKYQTTDREDMLKRLRDHEFIVCSKSVEYTFDCPNCSVHLYKVLNLLLNQGSRGAPHQCLGEYMKTLSICNKIKSMKILNTRRNTLLILDTIMLNKFLDLEKVFGHVVVERVMIMQSLMTVNDRLLSIDVLMEMLEKKMTRNPLWFLKVNEKLRKLCPPEVYQSIEEYVHEVDRDHWFELKLTLHQTWPAKPLIDYKGKMRCTCVEKDSNNKNQLSDLTEEKFQLLLKKLSSFCLGITNSLKTSAVAKLRVNQPDDYYGKVTCSEVFFQSLDKEHSAVLLYQKTGEKSRAYGLAFNNVVTGQYTTEASFYCDPKRFFLPIMSDVVLFRMCNEMLSWLDYLSDDVMLEVRTCLYRLVLSILCTPSKRVQVYIQGLRYFIMAFVNEFHCTGLLDKLKVTALTESERYCMKLCDDLVVKVLNSVEDENMAKAFKFVLNTSYLCHLITKETPDRLTDQIKCFEKFLEPKLDFGSVIVNPDSSCELTAGQEEQFYQGLEKLFTDKKLESSYANKPGVCKEVLNVCMSLFNSGALEVKPLLNHDPITPSFTSTALDLSSNKSVVVPKLDELGEVLTEYDYSKLVSSVVVDLVEHFKTKGKYVVSPRSLQYKIYKRLSNLVQQRAGKGNKESELTEEEFLEQVTAEQLEVINKVETKVSRTLSGIKLSSDTENAKHDDDYHLKKLWSKDIMVRIKAETSLHEVKDFNVDTLPFDLYRELVDAIYNDPAANSHYFSERIFNPCPLELLIKNLTLKAYKEEDFFECFKYILISSNFDNKVGKYDHKNRSRLGLSSAALLVKDEARISMRESNSESIAKRLDKSFFTNSSLRNLCFYSDESPTERTSVSSNVGKLKFGLSYKEQVGGNRELYVGDLNTKLTTRLVEDYAESLTSDMKYTCLNNENEFERALLDMKSVVRQSGLAVSMDHSKWGPHMSPALFSLMLRGLDFRLKDGTLIDKEAVVNILSWHIHKMVEVPFNVVEAYLKGFIKRGLGLMDRGGATRVEEFMFGYFDQGIVPSHISSVIDMGQGILHNLSDLYGLITEQFIVYALDLCYSSSFMAYTSSDDEILLSISNSFKRNDGSMDMDLAIEALEFHYFLSDRLNKFVSPKTVAGTFASEFKSRFFIWSQEVPLLTKFVAASLHNVKAKAPSQLAETIDTILDQSVANGVSIEIIGAIAPRTNALITYSGHPFNLFLCLEETDVRDWVDGSRGYRLQRSIENAFPDDVLPEIIRSACRKIFYRIQSGTLEEDYIVTTLQQSPDDCLKQMLTSCDVEKEAIDDICNYRWLNLRAHGDLRLVLRTKIMTSTRTLQKEEVPSLIKSVQSKLSKNFVRGAKKILADAINKSAFQSCISSGFVGVCKSMGSKCVRDGKGGFKYIKDILKEIKHHEKPDCHFCKELKGIYCSELLENISEFSRPLFWDYFSLVLSNACELGNWVFCKIEIPKSVYHLNNPNHFWPIKPSSHAELEEKVGMNHVLYSIRRNFPVLFDEHISPYLSDLNMLKLNWVQKIRFLDICVAIDMTSECLGIISHIIRRKREELYIVKQSELSMSHTRVSLPLERGFNIEPDEVCHNFLLQILFESMIHPVLLTTSQFKRYFWYSEVELLPKEALHDLGQFTQFIIDCKVLNSSRAMCLDDLDVGYVSSKVKRTDTYLNLSTFMTNLDWENRHEYSSFEDLILSSPSEVFLFEITFTFSHIRRSHKFRYDRSTNYILKTKLVIEKSELVNGEDGVYCVTPHSIEYYVSQSSGNHISLDGVSLLVLDPLISGRELVNMDELLQNQDVTFSAPSQILSKIKLDFKPFTKEIKNKFSYKLIGPDVDMSPLHLDKGAIKEGDRIVSQIEIQVSFKSVITAIELLDEDQRKIFVGNLFVYLTSLKSVNRALSMSESDLRLLVENYPSVIEYMLSGCDGWLNCGSFSLIKSKTLQCIMLADERGPYRIKGQNCRRLFPTEEAIEIE